MPKLSPAGSKENLRKYLLAGKMRCLGTYVECRKTLLKHGVANRLDDVLRRAVGEEFEQFELKANKYWTLDDIREALVSINANMWHLLDDKSLRQYRRWTARQCNKSTK
jgi:hypothetical protein